MKKCSPSRRKLERQVRRQAMLVRQIAEALARALAQHRIVPLFGVEMCRAIAGIRAVRTMPSEDLPYFFMNVDMAIELLIKEKRAVMGIRRADGCRVIGHPYIAMGLFGGGR